MFEWLNFWKKEEPDTAYPPNFIKVAVNPIARSQGIYDKHNQLILWYKNGKLFKTLAYSEEQVEAIRSTYEIPVVYEENSDEEDFEFDTIAEFGVTRLKK